MADEMYDEAAPPTSEDASVANDSNDTKDENEKDDNKSEETEEQLSLVPKHFFKDAPKPGNREMVEVVSVYDDEVSIKCVYGDKDDKSGKEEDESPAEIESEPEDAMMS
jgi:hypothetical protein